MHVVDDKADQVAQKIQNSMKRDTSKREMNSCGMPHPCPSQSTPSRRDKLPLFPTHVVNDKANQVAQKIEIVRGEIHWNAKWILVPFDCLV
jgi:uncharacterized protein YlzI (FlbEa/FlbD family)